MSSSSSSALASSPSPLTAVAQYSVPSTRTDWGTTAKIIALKTASYLTGPVCKVREYFYTFYILSATCKTTAEKAVKVVCLTLGIVACVLLTPVTAPFGVAIRGVIATLKPYIYLKRAEAGKVLPANREITVVSHNQCYMPAGYSITHGGVTPPSRARMDANIEDLRALDPDIICLYEVPDVCDACYISSQLSKYPFIVPVAGTRAIGPSSMMYVASKYEIVEDSIQFVPFIKGVELTGEAKHSEKGFLSFAIKSQDADAPFATIISTHLQHSKIPAEPNPDNPDDKQARALQMAKIGQKINEVVAKGGAVIFTGDLNQQEDELSESTPLHLRRDSSVVGKPTWGGDRWCATLMGQPPSEPLVLDYTFVAGRVSNISTHIIQTGYSGLEFSSEAKSDHYLLFSTITIA